MIYPTLEQYALAKGAALRSPRIVLPFHRRMYRAITQWAAGCLPAGARNLAIAIPPRHGKTLAAHDTIEWLMGMVPDSKWIYTSHTAHLAVTQTMEIRDIMLSDWYRRMFPATQALGTRQNYVTTTAGGQLYGVGMSGTITGFGAGCKRCEFGGAIVIDDPISSDDARSATERAHVNEWYTQTLKSRRNHDTTPILLIMQRLHTDDLLGHILSTEGNQWHILQLQAMDETGDMLWPETFSRASAEQMREVDPATWFAQYQQTPIIPGGNIIKLGWWSFYDPAEHVSNGLRFITADTAFKEHSDNDASVIQCWDAQEDGLFFVDSIFGRWDFPRLLQNAKAFYHICGEPREFWIEDKASGTPLEQILADDGLPAYAWTPKQYSFPDDKVSRMQTAAWVVHGGKVFLPRGNVPVRMDNGRVEHVTPGAAALMEEAAAFARDMSHAHDDHCDAFTMAVSLYRDAGGGV
jgi:predicted phage terminase large subunit-like protein